MNAARRDAIDALESALFALSQAERTIDDMSGCRSRNEASEAAWSARDNIERAIWLLEDGARP